MAPQVNFQDFCVGDELLPLEKEPVTESQLVKYAGASGDFNPLHTVDMVGKLVGFNGVIAHGMLIMGFTAQAITGWFPNRSLKEFKARFTAVTRPNDSITVTGKIIAIGTEDRSITGEVTAADQNGDIKLTGQFEVLLR